MMLCSRTCLLAAALALCAPLAAAQPAQDAVSSAQAAVRKQLFAPDSATFRRVTATRTGNVCGEVDSRNIEGGRSGYARFVYDRRKETATLSLHDPDFRQFFVMDDNEYTNGNAAVITNDACRFTQLWVSTCTPDLAREERHAQKLCKLYAGGPRERARLKTLVGFD